MLYTTEKVDVGQNREIRSTNHSEAILSREIPSSRQKGCRFPLTTHPLAGLILRVPQLNSKNCSTMQKTRSRVLFYDDLHILKRCPEQLKLQ